MICCEAPDFRCDAISSISNAQCFHEDTPEHKAMVQRHGFTYRALLDQHLSPSTLFGVEIALDTQAIDRSDYEAIVHNYYVA